MLQSPNTKSHCTLCICRSKIGTCIFIFFQRGWLAMQFSLLTLITNPEWLSHRKKGFLTLSCFASISVFLHQQVDYESLIFTKEGVVCTDKTKAVEGRTGWTICQEKTQMWWERKACKIHSVFLELCPLIAVEAVKRHLDVVAQDFGGSVFGKVWNWGHFHSNNQQMCCVTSALEVKADKVPVEATNGHDGWSC